MTPFRATCNFKLIFLSFWYIKNSFNTVYNMLAFCIGYRFFAIGRKFAVQLTMILGVVYTYCIGTAKCLLNVTPYKNVCVILIKIYYQSNKSYAILV